ncbi:MAG: chemotaxis protein CheW [Chthoniobacteraceae bacterium]|nr:chemotaxis protein CheW [Chthoniobacteraceae bacterium]
MNEPVIDACWDRIGVFGDKSCPELPRHIRCLNCEVFHAAAAALLDRPAPEGYLDFWTERIALPRQEQRKGTRSAVVFRIGVEWLALPAEIFAEVAEPRPVHSLPHRPDGLVLGLTAIRGELLICIALPRLLGFEASASAAPSQGRSVYERMLVVGHGGERVVFPVDEVHAGVRYHPDDLRPVPSTVAQAAAPFTLGLLSWEDRNVGVLDDALLFYALGRQLA